MVSCVSLGGGGLTAGELVVVLDLDVISHLPRLHGRLLPQRTLLWSNLSSKL